MASRLDDLLARIAQLEQELEVELGSKQRQWRYKVDARRIRFERDVQLAHTRPIRHAQRVLAPHAHYAEFVDYGDADGYRKQLPMIRDKLK